MDSPNALQPISPAGNGTPKPAPQWHSGEIHLLAEALVKAQAEIEDAPRSGNNAFKGYHYATIADIRAATKAPLAAHGLAITQLPFTSPDGHSIKLRSILLHTSGQWICSELVARCEGQDREKAGVLDMQKVGSALTYMRKYALAAMVGVAADDDDGQATTSQGNAPQGYGHQHQRRDQRQPQRQLENRRESRRDDRRQQRQGQPQQQRQEAQAQPEPPWEGRDPEYDDHDAGSPPPDFRTWLTEWVKFGNEWWIDQWDRRQSKPPEGYPTLINQYQLVRHLYKWAAAEGVILPGKAMPDKPSSAQIERLLTDVFGQAYVKFDAEAEHYIKTTRPRQIKDEIDAKAAKKAG